MISEKEFQKEIELIQKKFENNVLGAINDNEPRKAIRAASSFINFLEAKAKNIKKKYSGQSKDTKATDFVMDKPKTPEFKQKEMKGYKFPTANDNLEVYLLEVSHGHENYIKSKKSTHFYYIVEGQGSFDINGVEKHVSKGQFVEIPPKVEYTYSGKMRILMIMEPPWIEGNDEVTKKNPNV